MIDNDKKIVEISCEKNLYNSRCKIAFGCMNENYIQNFYNLRAKKAIEKDCFEFTAFLFEMSEFLENNSQTSRYHKNQYIFFETEIKNNKKLLYLFNLADLVILTTVDYFKKDLPTWQ